MANEAEASLDELRNQCANFLLLSNIPFRIEHIELCVSRWGIDKENLVMLLESDSENRFLIQKIDDDQTLVSKNSTLLCANDVLVMDQLERWRHNLAFLLLEKAEAIELSLIGSTLLKLPIMVKKKLKLKDIILYDPLQRFQIIGKPPMFSVKRIFSDDERVGSIMDWLSNIFDYLVEKGWYADLNEIALQFKRPFHLPNTVRLLDTLRNDTLNRFYIDGEGCDLRVKAIIDPIQAEKYAEIWRDSVALYLFKQGSLGLSQIGASVPRPSRLPGECKLQDVLRSDPFGRFYMKGPVNHVIVKLTKASYNDMNALDCSDEAYKEDCDTISDGEWTKIVSKSSKFVPLKPKGGIAKSISQSKSNAFETSNILNPRPLADDLYSVGIKTPIGPIGTNSAFRIDPPGLLQQQTIENPSSNFLGSLLNVSSQMHGHDYFSPSVPSIQEDFTSFSSPLAMANDNWLNAQTSLSMSLPSLSPFVSPSLLMSENIESISNVNGNTNWLELKLWLPIAFDGFDPDLIKGFIALMRDDFGYVSTEDLYNAKLEGQLSFEALKEIAGFKIGHFNRLVKRLELLGHSS